MQGLSDHAGFVHEWGDDAIWLSGRIAAGDQDAVTARIEHYWTVTHPNTPVDPVAVRAVWHRLMTDFAAYPTIQQAAYEWTIPVPGPPETPEALHPLVIGHWSGNFLHRAFFGPAIAARPPDARRAYFSGQAGLGYTHVLINAHQDDWGPRRGNPHWTSGGFWAYDRMDEFKDVLREARRAGLSPIVGCIDRPFTGRDLDTIISRCQQLVDACGEHIAGYWPVWEADEIFPNSTEYEDGMARLIQSVDWHGKDVGIHNADGLKGGFNYFGRLGQIYPGHVVRWQQFTAGLTVSQLQTQSKLTAEVAAGTDTKVCAAEHSSELNQSPTYVEDEARERALACVTVMRDYLSPERTGSLNG